MKKKIISIIIAIFTISILFNMYEVQAVGRVAVSWAYDGDGNGANDLFFRTYTGPHNSTVYEYQNTTSNIEKYENDYKYYAVKKSGDDYVVDKSKTYTVKWIKNTTNGVPSCSAYTFKTIGLRFHWLPFNKFTTASDGEWGYTYNSKGNVLTKDLSSLETEFKNTEWVRFSSAEHQNTENNNIMHVYNTIVEDKKLSPRTITQYRHAIVSAGGATHIFVADNVVFDKTTKFTYADGEVNSRNDYKYLVKVLLNKEKEQSGYMNDIGVYVSNVIISQAVDSKGNPTGKYDVMKTAKQFINEKNKTYAKWGWNWWGNGTKGSGSNGLESVFNLFDNQINANGSVTKRTVWVRHLNIGLNTQISTSIVNNGTKMTSSNPTLLRTKDGSTYAKVAMNKNYTNDTWSEKYSDKLYITYGFRKSAYPANNADEDKVTMKCIGSNYATETASGTAAHDTLKSKISKGTMSTDTTVTVAGKSATSNEDYTIIDFYYTTYDKTVTVNHILVDDNGQILDKASQVLPVNASALEGLTGSANINTVLKRSNTSTSIMTEKYNKKLGYDIVVNRLADREEFTEYIGYNTAKEIDYGGLVLEKDLNKGTSFKFTGNGTNDNEVVQVNFYYKTEDIPIPKPPPTTTPTGKIFLTPENSPCISCTDTTDGIVVQTVPGNSTAKVGLTDLPQYILGGIEAVERKVDGNIYIKFSNKTVTIPYRAIYSKIENIAAYKITNITLDDSTNNMFNWSNQRLSLGGPNKNKSVTPEVTPGNIKIRLKNSSGGVINEVTLTSGQDVTFNMTGTAYSENYIVNVTSLNDMVKINGTQMLISTGNTKDYVLKNTQSIILDKANMVQTSAALSLYNGATGIPNTKITVADYTNSYKIPKDIENGLKTITGSVVYTSQIIYGNNTKTVIKDSVYYCKENAVFEFNIGNKLTKSYGINTTPDASTGKVDKYKYITPINIYTPITVTAAFKNVSEDNKGDLQAGDTFTITMNSTPADTKYQKATTPYVKAYYVKFDFDVSNVELNGSRRYNKGMLVEAGNWIKVDAKSSENTVLKAKAQSIPTKELTYKVRAVTVNVNESMELAIKSYDLISSEIAENVWAYINGNICNGTREYSYFADTSGKIATAKRLFDFRVTDLKDVNWKSVFRKTTGSNVNKHTGVVYYSGNKYFDMDTSKYATRATKQLGTNPVKTLPLGPYKNTNTAMVSAPKIGYRFSFDIKVLESMVNANRRININTEFYYVSKDGKTYYKEATDGKNGILLFYKNSSGKYVKIDTAVDTLKFVPNDGYRYITEQDRTYLSKEEQVLGNYRNITLTDKMVTLSDRNEYTTYYGEYKIPNSTIVVLAKNGKYDLNKPLKDGYVGVKFNISSNITNTENSMRDYSFLTEGFLNNNKAIKLEKGTWNLSDERYKEVSQTVIFYDLDSRAAEDFE